MGQGIGARRRKQKARKEKRKKEQEAEAVVSDEPKKKVYGVELPDDFQKDESSDEEGIYQHLTFYNYIDSTKISTR